MNHTPFLSITHSSASSCQNLDSHIIGLFACHPSTLLKKSLQQVPVPRVIQLSSPGVNPIEPWPSKGWKFPAPSGTCRYQTSHTKKNE